MSYIRDDVSTKRRVGMVLTYALLILFAILAIAPLLWLAMNSFKTSQEYQMNRLGFPRRFFWQNYTQAWQRGHFGVYPVFVSVSSLSSQQAPFSVMKMGSFPPV